MNYLVLIAIILGVVVTGLSPVVMRYSVRRPCNGEKENLRRFSYQVEQVLKHRQHGKV